MNSAIHSHPLDHFIYNNYAQHSTCIRGWSYHQQMFSLIMRADNSKLIINSRPAKKAPSQLAPTKLAARNPSHSRVDASSSPLALHSLFLASSATMHHAAIFPKIAEIRATRGAAVHGKRPAWAGLINSFSSWITRCARRLISGRARARETITPRAVLAPCARVIQVKDENLVAASVTRGYKTRR